MGFRQEARRRSPLELFHPHGFIERWVAFGDNCPARLLPDVGRRADSGADLVILAPSIAESGDKSWLERTVHLSIDCLNPGGIMYLSVPASRRMVVTRMLAGNGLGVDQPVIHLPNWQSSYHLIPLQPGPVHYALSDLLPAPSWKRHVAPIVLRLPAIRDVLASQLSSIGLIASHSETQPLQWVNTVAERAEGTVDHVVMSVSRRDSPDKAVLHCFTSAVWRPAFVVKVALSDNGAGKLDDEVDALSSLGISAERAGAMVPRVTPMTSSPINSVMVQSALPGRTAAALLATNPDQLVTVVEKLFGWLLAWNKTTVSRKFVKQSHLEREILTPAEQLAAHVPHGEAYVGWLRNRCMKLLDVQVPFVAAHRDLTMHNVLLEGAGQIAIVDWESGTMEAAPLADFFYAIVDTVLATRLNEDRLAAFTSCFTEGGAFRSLVVEWQSHFMRTLDISNEWVELCFHACWLHHAHNEYKANGESSQMWFLKIVQRLASQKYSWTGASANVAAVR